MKMKFSLLTIALAITAFAVPALASGAVLKEGATTLPAGTKITGTSTNATTKVSAGTLLCTSVTVTGELTQNTEAGIKGVGVGAGFGTTCTVNGKAATVSDITLSSLESTKLTEPKPGEKVLDGKINVTFKAVIAGTTCHFATPEVVFTSVVGTDSLNISNGDLVGTPAATCEPGTLNGDFTLETDVSPFTAIVLT